MGLDSVDLLVQVEKHFGISISDIEAEKIITVQDFVNIVFSKILAKNHDALLDPKKLCSQQDVEEIIKGIFEKSTGIPAQNIKLKDRISSDLGID